jgi:hypothetical protein
MDRRSWREALSCFIGKPPALRGLPFLVYILQPSCFPDRNFVFELPPTGQHSHPHAELQGSMNRRRSALFIVFRRRPHVE